MDIVRKIFEMSVKGMGAGAIARYLNRNRVPVIGDGKSWHSSYISAS